VLHKCHLKFYKLALNSNNNRITHKEFCGCLGTDLCSISWFVFLNFWPLLLWMAITFFLFFFFWRFSAPDEPIGGIQVLFKHKKQWTPPLWSSLPRTLKCYRCNSIAINEQLKYLTHMLCLWISFYKLYKKGLFSYVLTLKYMCHFGMSFKKLNLKVKHKIKTKIS